MRSARRASSLKLDARRALVSRITVDLDSAERVVLGAELMSFRLRAARSKRGQRTNGTNQESCDAADQA